MSRHRDRHHDASGRFVLRIDPGLHSALREAASASNLSLNEYCARKLALPGGNVSDLTTTVVERAVQVGGRNLKGVVAFGSWVRGELSDTSDIDVLVVLDEGAPIERQIYHTWDRSPIEWNQRPIEPHFVHLPDEDGRVGSIWAEAAVEGIVLFERDLVVSRSLVTIRRRIAAGEMVRRVSHGQHYWVEVA